jgi:hypothetical protein
MSQARITAIIPCNDLEKGEAFFARLGLTRPPADKARVAGLPASEDTYRILQGAGMEVHLNQAVEGWVVAERNNFGIYVYCDGVDRVDELAAEFKDEIIEAGKAAELKPWGMYEFSLNGPDGCLVRVGKQST